MPSIECVRSLVSYAKFNFVGTIGGYAYSWIDILVIGFFMTKPDVSSYEFAWRVTEIVILFSNSIALSTLPQVSQWDANEATGNIEDLLENGITASLFFVVPAFFGTMLFAEEILGLLFGSEYTIASVAMIILMAEAVFQAAHKVLSRVLLGVNKPHLAAKATVLSIITNLILNVVFVIQFGLPGAAAATGISFTVNTFLHGWYLSQFVSVRINFQDVGKCLVSALGMTTILFALHTQLEIKSLPILLGIIVIGGVLYIAFAMAFSSLRVKTIRSVRTVLGK